MSSEDKSGALVSSVAEDVSVKRKHVLSLCVCLSVGDIYIYLTLCGKLDN